MLTDALATQQVALVVFPILLFIHLTKATLCDRGDHPSRLVLSLVLPDRLEVEEQVVYLPDSGEGLGGAGYQSTWLGEGWITYLPGQARGGAGQQFLVFGVMRQQFMVPKDDGSAVHGLR